MAVMSAVEEKALGPITTQWIAIGDEAQDQPGVGAQQRGTEAMTYNLASFNTGFGGECITKNGDDFFPDGRGKSKGVERRTEVFSDPPKWQV